MGDRDGEIAREDGVVVGGHDGDLLQGPAPSVLQALLVEAVGLAGKAQASDHGQNGGDGAEAEEGAEDQHLAKLSAQIASFGLVEKSGKRVPDRTAQLKGMQFYPFLIAVHRLSDRPILRRACLRCMGNLILHRSVEAMEAPVRACVRAGSVAEAVHVIDKSNAARFTEGERREAMRMLNNVAASTEWLALQEEGAVEHIVKHLSTFQEKEEETEVIGMAVGCISHLCYRRETHDNLLKSGVAEVLLPIASSHSSKHKFVRAMLGLASLVGEEENHPALKASEDMITSISEALEAALASRPYPPSSHTFNRPIDIVKSLYYLAGSDANKPLFLKGGTFSVLLGIIQGEDLYSEELRERATSTVRRVVFLDDAAQALHKTPGFKAFLARAMTNAKNQSERNQEKKESLAGSLSALSWQLNHVSVTEADRGWQQERATKRAHALKKQQTNRQLQHPSEPVRVQVMLSYNWAHQEKILRINRYLTEHGFNTWIDVEQMKGSTLDGMARAVESSDLVLVFFSKEYKTSPNCRLEANYAHKLGKPIIPVRVDDYDADGWLGLLIGTQLWYDVRDMETGDVLQRLLDEVRARAGLVAAAPLSSSVVDDPQHGSDSNATAVLEPQPQTQGQLTTQPLPPPSIIAAPTLSAMYPSGISPAFAAEVSLWTEERVLEWVATLGCQKLTHGVKLSGIAGDGLVGLAVSAVVEGPLSLSLRLKDFFPHSKAIARTPLLKFAVKLYTLARGTEARRDG